MSFRADELLSRYGPIVRISPGMVLVNDPQVVLSLFSRQDLQTAPSSIRALRVGGHDWTVTHPHNHVARERRRPVMMATTTKAMKHWHPVFEDNISKMICNISLSNGSTPEEIMLHLRTALLLNAEVVMAGGPIQNEPANVSKVVSEYNFLVVWRLCLPEWTFKWLKMGPFTGPKLRINSSDSLFDLGSAIVNEAKVKNSTLTDRDEVSTIYELLMDKQNKTVDWTHDEISAEIAGQILAATETTASALTFIFYEMAKNPDLVEQIYSELKGSDEQADSDMKLINACISEGLRFRPPVALTGSRVIPSGGMNILGYHLPAGTVVTTQSLSLSRQRPDLFPNYNEFDPLRWLVEDKLAERRRCSMPFGVGARRCPGGNMATYQMRMVIEALVRTFKISIPPETTPELMTPFEANGFRSRDDKCHLIFMPRASKSAGGSGKDCVCGEVCECGPACDCVVCECEALFEN